MTGRPCPCRGDDGTGPAHPFCAECSGTGTVDGSPAIVLVVAVALAIYSVAFVVVGLLWRAVS